MAVHPYHRYPNEAETWESQELTKLLMVILKLERILDHNAEF